MKFKDIRNWHVSKVLSTYVLNFQQSLRWKGQGTEMLLYFVGCVNVIDAGKKVYKVEYLSILFNQSLKFVLVLEKWHE